MGTFLFHQEHLGNGEDIESFASYYCRLAQLHCTSLDLLARLLREWYARQHPDAWIPTAATLYTKGKGLLGVGRSTEFLIEAVQQANGASKLRRGTLMSLRGAISDRARQSSGFERKWCPYCWREDQNRGVPAYDRLLWSVPPIQRCPIHQSRLLSHCLKCGESQRRFSSDRDILRCFRCDAQLHSFEPERDPRPGFGEWECREIVRAISDGEMDILPEHPLEDFLSELRSIAPPLGRRFIRDESKRRPPAKMGFHTLLKQAVRSGVSVSLILQSPREAARSAGQLIRPVAKIPVQAKPRQPKAVRRRIAEVLGEQMTHPFDEPMLSLRMIAKAHAVTMGYIRYALRDLVPAYQKARASHCIAQARRSLGSACTQLDEMILEEGEAALFREQKELARVLSMRAACSIPMALRAISFLRTPVAKKLAEQVSFGDLMQIYYADKSDRIRPRIDQTKSVTTDIWDRLSFDVTPSQLLTVHGRLVAQCSERHAYQATFHIYEAYRTWLLRLLTFDMARRMYESVATNPSVVLKQFLKCSSKGQSSNLLPGSARRRVLKARLNRRRNLELKLRR